MQVNCQFGDRNMQSETHHQLCIKHITAESLLNNLPSDFILYTNSIHESHISDCTQKQQQGKLSVGPLIVLITKFSSSWPKQTAMGPAKWMFTDC